MSQPGLSPEQQLQLQQQILAHMRAQQQKAQMQQAQAGQNGQPNTLMSRYQEWARSNKDIHDVISANSALIMYIKLLPEYLQLLMTQVELQNNIRQQPQNSALLIFSHFTQFLITNFSGESRQNMDELRAVQFLSLLRRHILILNQICSSDPAMAPFLTQTLQQSMALANEVATRHPNALTISQTTLVTFQAQLQALQQQQQQQALQQQQQQQLQLQQQQQQQQHK